MIIRLVTLQPRRTLGAGIWGGYLAQVTVAALYSLPFAVQPITFWSVYSYVAILE